MDIGIANLKIWLEVYITPRLPPKTNQHSNELVCVNTYHSKPMYFFLFSHNLCKVISSMCLREQKTPDGHHNTTGIIRLWPGQLVTKVRLIENAQFTFRSNIDQHYRKSQTPRARTPTPTHMAMCFLFDQNKYAHCALDNFNGIILRVSSYQISILTTSREQHLVM